MINIGKKIEEVLREERVSISSFALKINTNRNNVYDIFKRKSIDTDLLYKISKILNYNFFELYVGGRDSDKILIERTKLAAIEESYQKSIREIKQLEGEISQLKQSGKDKQLIIDLLTKKHKKKAS